MERQDRPCAQVITRAGRMMSLAAIDLLIIVGTNPAALVATLLADLEAVATLLGLVSAPVPARRLAFAEVRQRPRAARISGGEPRS